MAIPQNPATEKVPETAGVLVFCFCDLFVRDCERNLLGVARACAYGQNCRFGFRCRNSNFDERNAQLELWRLASTREKFRDKRLELSDASANASREAPKSAGGAERSLDVPPDAGRWIDAVQEMLQEKLNRLEEIIGCQERDNPRKKIGSKTFLPTRTRSLS